jgi:Matrixin
MVQIDLTFKQGLDGFDPEPTDGGAEKYQMVPVGREREFVVFTESLGAEFKFNAAGVALVGEIREFNTNNLLPDTAPGVFSDRPFRIPPRTKVKFKVRGRTPGTVFLSGRDLATDADITIDVDVLISVKAELPRRFAFVLFSDPLRDVVKPEQYDPREIFRDVKLIFFDQANVTLRDVDEGSPIKNVLMLFDLHDKFPVDDESLREKVNKRVNEVFPDLFQQTDFIVYVFSHVTGKHSPLGVTVQTKDKLNTVYLGVDPSDRPGRVHTMAHEFGHAMGLPHLAKLNTLMFPNIKATSNRIIAGHIEQLSVGPIFPNP